MSAGRKARVVAILSSWVSAFLVVPAQATEPAPIARPQDTAIETARAADLYDEATRLYEAGQYSAAAEKYLEADAVVPSSEALSNAIATARKADAPLLVARAARRAIARELLDPALAERARVALAEVEPQLEQLEAHSEPATATSEPVLQPEPAPARPAPPERPAQAAHSDAPRYVFWIGIGVTGVLTGVTVWSGLDALHDEDTLPSRSDPNYSTAATEVNDSAVRTDWLLAATLLSAASTAAVGIWAVDWEEGSRGVRVGAAPLANGALLRCWGHFQ